MNIKESVGSFAIVFCMVLIVQYGIDSYFVKTTKKVESGVDFVAPSFKKVNKPVDYQGFYKKSLEFKGDYKDDWKMEINKD